MIVVTDHALVRYLERRYGMDFSAWRKEITDLCETAAHTGAESFSVDNVKFMFARNGGSDISVTTVLERTMGGSRTKGQKNQQWHADPQRRIDHHDARQARRRRQNG